MPDSLPVLIFWLWGLAGVGGYFSLASKNRLLVLEHRSKLKVFIVASFALLGPIGLAGGFVAGLFVKSRSYCPNYRCRKISLANDDVCPYCGFNKNRNICEDKPIAKNEIRVPACLSGLKVEYRLKPKNQIIFVLGCSCGCQHGYVLGHYDNSSQHEPLFTGPLALECAECQKVTEIFDESINGYDAEQGTIHMLQRTREGRERFRTPDAKPMQLEATLTYSHGYALPSIPGSQDHPEDYFDWFTLTGKQQGTRSVFVIADVECA